MGKSINLFLTTIISSSPTPAQNFPTCHWYLQNGLVVRRELVCRSSPTSPGITLTIQSEEKQVQVVSPLNGGTSWSMEHLHQDTLILQLSCLMHLCLYILLYRGLDSLTMGFFSSICQSLTQSPILDFNEIINVSEVIHVLQ